MELMSIEEITALINKATELFEHTQKSLVELMEVLEKREGSSYVGSIDHATYSRYQKEAQELFEIAHQILLDVEQRPDGYDEVFEMAVTLVTLSFRIVSGAEVSYRRYCIQKGIAITKLTDLIKVPRQTLEHWRQLVDDNPSDLAPRIGAYLKDTP